MQVDTVDLTDIELEERIGIGATSYIYKGKWKDKVIAVKQFISYPTQKILQDGVMKSFNHELNIMLTLAQYPHTNIIKLLAVNNSYESPLLVLEYMPNSVYEWLSNPKMRTIEWSVRMKIALEVAEGLNHLHQLQPPLLHNDIRTDNLLIDDTGIVHIIDFGQSSFATENKKAELTCFGAPGWSAPEILAGGFFSKNSDIYSLAYILWELLTREDPFPGVDETTLLKILLTGERPKISEDCNIEYANLIRKCWATVPEERPTSSDILMELQHIFKIVCATAQAPIIVERDSNLPICK